MRKPKEIVATILLICEGENTEPHFIEGIRDCVIDGEYDIGNIRIAIHPEPRIVEEEESNIRGRKKRKLRNVETEPENDIKGVPPLKWIVYGQEQLKDGTYDEVWTIFDHDNHPARKEAFELASHSINGKYVKIAYSSISFEYYLLLHFERIYKAFEKSECREGKIITHCMFGDVVGCGGNKCVGGYLRKNGYIDGSTKDNRSTFNLVKDKLEIGYENSAWLRYMSSLEERNKENWDRNPFVTTDDLVRRLTGHRREYVWISKGEEYCSTKYDLCIEFSEEIFEVENIGNRTIIIQADSLCAVSEEGERILFGERKLLVPGCTTSFDLKDKVGNWYFFDYEELRIMFEFK